MTPKPAKRRPKPKPPASPPPPRTEQGIKAKLAELRREAAKEWHKRTRAAERALRPLRKRPALAVAVGFVVSLLVLGVLPFYALVRGSVYLHEHQGFPAWLALAAGALLTLGIVAGYGAWILRAVTGTHRFRVVAVWIALPVVTFYVGSALVYVSSLHVKSPAVRAYYTSLHPLLRVALATVILVDRKAVITDVGRTRADYEAMKLPVNERTLHYRQRDGYVHAVDLRTSGRGAVRNALTRVYFWTMGFDTLRHVGTGDHLHVSLPVR